MANMVKAAKKAWKTRRANEEAAKWTLAGKKAWATRRANALVSRTGLRTLSYRELRAALKGELRVAGSKEERDSAYEAYKNAMVSRRQHLAAKKAWRTIRANAK